MYSTNKSFILYFQYISHCQILQDQFSAIRSCKSLFIQTEGNYVGANVSFTCDGGYQLKHGNHVLSCNAEGNWTGLLPRCVPRDCSKPPDRLHTDVHFTATTYLHMANYTCHEGYILETGASSVIQCLAAGVWQDPPTCVIIECPVPPVGLHIAVEISSLQYLGTLNYSCSIGYGIISG